MATIVEAAARSDLDTLKFAAQGLRVSAARIGAQQLSDHCERLVVAAGTQDASRALALAVELSGQFETARTALMEFLRTPIAGV